MNPITLSLIESAHALGFDSSGLVFTHAKKARLLILGLFCSFVMVFLYLNRFLMLKYSELSKVPAVFTQSQDLVSRSFPYFILFGSWLIALAVLFYFLMATIDIWGLQVTISEKRILVSNTILGSWFQKIAKTGHLDLDQIEEIRMTPYQTRLIAHQCQLRFSPVDRLEVLIGLLLKNAPQARLIE